ncbi:putative quinol monooxygenase [Sphingomonas sp. OTU376]|uniref:putative quinol monooxygenase n=1 Tax=Sphingomonas sp. OTU376 TaxID=3043863 RepID=UPI00313D3A6F
MSDSIKVVARVVITPGKEEVFEKNAVALCAATRLEEGCLSYHLFRNPAQTGVYVFVEDWASHQIWQHHMDGEALRIFNARLPAGTIANIEIHPLLPVA